MDLSKTDRSKDAVVSTFSFYPRGEILLRITLPNGEPIDYVIPLDGIMDRAEYLSLTHLPAGHDNPIDFPHRRIAKSQIEDREFAIKKILQQMQYIIRDVLRKQDPINGYTPEEMAQM